ncbi:winged helix DNA-binding protein [Mesorhizobium sp. J428]|uniref:winged helix DNA-binding protein n=1 Tax=Mesorhizobium sp. J428 TaxID=2898440 RepID=UPI002151AA3C|nr:winged helix DNA-binding protein [Mesorhizobium sp. J428]MCR5855350.1 winged helix DNA-binding protein [Mesorhizobium sp. J428]
MTAGKQTIGPVVSAAHLADGALPPLSEVEFALTIVSNAFQRWMVRGMAAAGVPGLTPIEVLILHAVNHRDREKTLADLCMMFNIEDTHIVAYALKKLEGLGLVAGGRRGKERTAKVTPAGAETCRRYRDIREALLVDSVQRLNFDGGELSAIAALMRALSGQYDQAARAASSM